MKIKVLLVTTERFALPLSATDEKKFRGMSEIADHYVVGFSASTRWKLFYRHAWFCLVPDLPINYVRQALTTLAVFLITLYLHVRKGISVAISLSPLDGFPVVLARLLLRVLGRDLSVVVQAHGDWKEAPFLLGRFPRILKPVVRRIGRFSLRHCSTVRTVSRSTRLDAAAITTRPCMEFPAFTDIDLFLEGGAEDRRERTEGTILYAGVLTPLKGVEHLLRAVVRLRRRGYRVNLVIAGDGEQRRTLERLAGELNLTTVVSFLGFLEQDELRRRMAQSDVLVLPSLTEGLPRVIMEAMACGIAVVASNVGGIPELVADGVTGWLVDPGSVESLSEKIAWLLDHDAERVEMGRRGRAVVERKYCNTAYFRNYKALIEMATAALDRNGLGSQGVEAERPETPECAGGIRGEE